MDSPIAIVLTGGAPLRAAPDLPGDALVIAADSGLHLAADLHLEVDVVVGDLDSVEAAALASARSAGVTVDEHPVDKDATDLELAVTFAIDHGANHIIVLGGWGGRFDHLLGNATLLAGPLLAHTRVEWHSSTATVRPCRPGAPVTISGQPGDLASLVPLGGDVHGVTTSGLAWPLNDTTLAFGTTRGISNRLVGDAAMVAVVAGMLVTIHERGPS